MKSFVLKLEDIHYGNLILVNKDYKLEQKKQLDLVSFNEKYKDILLSREANEFLQKILKKINSLEQIIPVSGYRSKEEQIQIFSSSLEENGEEFTLKYVALPDSSEHQTGLAIDLGLNQEQIDFIRPSFPDDGICKQFRDVMTDYGFIERYSEDKVDITHISKEEWHFRYVGYPHSKIIKRNHFCLEEYIEYLKNYGYMINPLVFDGYEISYLSLTDDMKEISIDDNTIISGNNVDGFIITRKI